MVSRKASSPAAYADVKYVLDLALNKPDLQYILKSPGAATNFKQRCNRYRNMIREMTAETLQNIPGVRAETAYDSLVIRQVNAELMPDRRGAILIFARQDLLGQLFDPATGEELELPGITNIISEK